MGRAFKQDSAGDRSDGRDDAINHLSKIPRNSQFGTWLARVTEIYCVDLLRDEFRIRGVEFVSRMRHVFEALESKNWKFHQVVSLPDGVNAVRPNSRYAPKDYPPESSISFPEYIRHLAQNLESLVDEDLGVILYDGLGEAMIQASIEMFPAELFPGSKPKHKGGRPPSPEKQKAREVFKQLKGAGRSDVEAAQEMDTRKMPLLESTIRWFRKKHLRPPKNWQGLHKRDKSRFYEDLKRPR